MTKARYPSNKLRTQLMREIEAILQAGNMAQLEVSTLFGVSPPRVSDLLQGRPDKFTLDTLIIWLSKLGWRVDLVVSDGEGGCSLVIYQGY